MPFLPPNQQRQSTEGTASTSHNTRKINYHDEIAVTINKTTTIQLTEKYTTKYSRIIGHITWIYLTDVTTFYFQKEITPVLTVLQNEQCCQQKH